MSMTKKYSNSNYHVSFCWCNEAKMLTEALHTHRVNMLHNIVCCIFVYSDLDLAMKAAYLVPTVGAKCLFLYSPILFSKLKEFFRRRQQL